ncbi:MAG: hypothetical protein MI725_17680, partial [Pirellulales bacterium]|nr:hypothetical protein [Pirellulales bacterium]
ETRLVASPKDVGRKAKCPDCGTSTKVPSPPKPRPKQVPRAMHGQQYGVWGVDQAPLPEELAARQPKYFPMFCRVCDTLMQAQVKQVGQKLTCPDCGAKTLVPEPPPEKPAKSVLVPDGEEYQLDEMQPPPPRSVPEPPAVRESQTHREYRESLQHEYGQRPQMPRLPLLRGVLPMLVRKPLPAWWLSLSAVGFVLLGLATLAATQHAFVAVCCLALAIMVGGICFAAATALCCAILTDSSEGCNRLYNAPPFIPHEWFAEAAYLGIAMVVSLIPASLIGRIAPEPMIGMALGMLLCFPIVLLSSLEQGSPLSVLSVRLVASLVRKPLHWLMFYLVTSLVIGGSVWAAWALMQSSAIASAAVVPLAVATVLLYFRLLGRFAWWLAESLPEDDSEQ